MKDKFKNSLNKYELDEDSLSNIKSNIYIKYKKHQRNKKIILSVVTCFFIVVSSLGIVYAEEIKSTVDKILVQYGYIIDEDGNKKDAIKVDLSIDSKINYQAKLEEPKCSKNISWTYGITKDDKCYTTYSIEEIEKELNIKLLKNDEFKNKDLILEIIRRDEKNNIQHIELKNINPYQIVPNEKGNYKNISGLKINLTISLTTKYNKESDNEMILPDLEGTNVKKIKLSKINGEAIVWDWGDNGFKFIWLETNDILYYFKIKTIGKIDEDKEIEKMLEKFYY